MNKKEILKDKLAKELVINHIHVSSPHPNQDDFEVLSFIVYNLINEAVAEERERNVKIIDAEAKLLIDNHCPVDGYYTLLKSIKDKILSHTAKK